MSTQTHPLNIDPVYQRTHGQAEKDEVEKLLLIFRYDGISYDLINDPGLLIANDNPLLQTGVRLPETDHHLVLAITGTLVSFDLRFGRKYSFLMSYKAEDEDYRFVILEKKTPVQAQVHVQTQNSPEEKEQDQVSQKEVPYMTPPPPVDFDQPYFIPLSDPNDPTADRWYRHITHDKWVDPHTIDSLMRGPRPINAIPHDRRWIIPAQELENTRSRTGEYGSEWEKTPTRWTVEKPEMAWSRNGDYGSGWEPARAAPVEKADCNDWIQEDEIKRMDSEWRVTPYADCDADGDDSMGWGMYTPETTRADKEWFEWGCTKREKW